MTAFVAGLASVTPNTPARGIVLSFFAGLGVGGLLLPAATILTIITPDEVIATITAATVSIRLVGASIGYSVYFNVLENKLAKILAPNVGTAAAEAGLPSSEIPAFLGAYLQGNTTALATYPLAVIGAATDAYKDSYAQAFKLVYLASIPFGVTAIICCLFLRDIRKYMTNRVAVDIH